MRDTNMPSNYEIVNYWRRRNITDDYTIEDCPDFCSNIICDPDIPKCFACGQLILPNDYLDSLEESVWTAARHKNKTEVEKQEFYIKRIWEDKHVKHRLQKCHIYPSALGGSNNPDNLFLMCKTCHNDSPDTKYPKQFFRFVRNRHLEGNIYVRAYKEARAICGNKLDEFMNTFDTINDMWDLMFDDINTHGFNYSQSSISSWLIEKCEEMSNDIR